MDNYGPKMDYASAKEALSINAELNLGSKTKFATCLWGKPGIGKTSFIKALENLEVEYKGKKYKGYKVIDIPPAQLEEMGDILGIPMECQLVTKGEAQKWVPTETIAAAVADGWTVDQSVAPTMRYAAPAWVPTVDEPTILLFDDWNRASSRLIKGVMQLIQNGGTISWQLPESVQIVLTGNPDTDGMLVAQLDSAIMTRIKSITIEPDIKGWSEWAMLQPDIHPAAIAYAKLYPEMIIGDNAEDCDNIRTFTEFGRAMTIVEKRGHKVSSNFAAVIGQQSISPALVAEFQNFVTRKFDFSLDPDKIFNSINTALAELKQFKADKRLDIINLSCERLLAAIVKGEKFTEEKGKAFRAFLGSEDMPVDCMFSVAFSLVESPNIPANVKANAAKWLAGDKAFVEKMQKALGMNNTKRK